MREVLGFLFPYLVLLYLFDCVARVRSGHLAFVSLFGRRFRLGWDGAHAVGLLPTSQALLSHNLPVFLSGDGIHVPAGESRWDRPLRAGDVRFIPWGEVTSAVPAGADVVVNGNISLTLPSEEAASRMAAAIHGVGAWPPAGRRQKAETLIAESYDLSAVERLRDELRPRFLAVSIASSLLFLSVYAVLPLALYARPFQGRSLAPVALAIALAYVLSVAAAFAARKAIDPDDRSGRVRLVLLLLLLPPGAAHVLGQLTRDLFARFDHLAIGAALLDPRAFRRLARKELARLAFAGIPPADAPLARAIRTKERAMRAFLARAGVDPDRIFDAPARQSPEAARYCPACEAEYLAGADRCSDCGIPLADFGEADGQAAGLRGQESACAKSGPG